MLPCFLKNRSHELVVRTAIFGTDYPTPDGTCIRDYIHVADVARAHIAALFALNKNPAQTFNVANGRGFSVREVIETARTVTGHPIPTLEKSGRTGDPVCLVASPEKLHRELRWRPRYPRLYDMISTAWQWHQAHPTGYVGRTNQSGGQ